MELLAGEIDCAERRLRIPAASEPVSGEECIQVVVDNAGGGRRMKCVWREDHAQVWPSLGMNAVQYQVATALLFSLALLQFTAKGRYPGTYSVSTLPIAIDEWPMLWRMMRENGIHWEHAESPNVQFEPATQVKFVEEPNNKSM